VNPNLARLLDEIRPVDSSLAVRAQARLDDLAKPGGSLGRLEETALRLFLMSGGREPLRVDPALVVVAVGDHGVVAEGISAYPQEVTGQMLRNILDGGAAISVLSRMQGMDMLVVDAGCLGEAMEHPRLVNLRLGRGTANLAAQPAMSVSDCEQALLCGADLTRKAVAGGTGLVALGEMGIGNSTPATALFCAFLGLPAGDVAGPGTGLNEAGVRHKAAVVEKALRTHAGIVRGGDPLAVLAALGGYEIAVLAGVVLGAAACRIPVLVDGFISTSAYTAARALHAAADGYAILAHASAEPGYGRVARALGQEPLLHLGMRLGEGTGCAAALPLLRAAAAVYNEMATFSGARVAGAIPQPAGTGAD
jgi:nicotinate-nucleotide--dimethylbenzimidazole phosphoribosyltransferase